MDCSTFAFDLHVLGTPPALILSQDQTLKLNLLSLASALRPRSGQLVQPVSLLIWLSDLEPMSAPPDRAFSPPVPRDELTGRSRTGSTSSVSLPTPAFTPYGAPARLQRDADTRRAVLARSI
jgi:hypothetical protein